ALAVVYVLQWMQSVLIPVVIGILVAYALEPYVSMLAKIKIPRAIGAALVLTIVVGAASGATYALADQAMQIVAQVPQAAARIRDRVRHHYRERGAIQQVQKAASELQKTADEATTAPVEPRTDAGVAKVQIVEPAFDAKSYLYWGGMGILGAAAQAILI